MQSFLAYISASNGTECCLFCHFSISTSLRTHIACGFKTLQASLAWSGLGFGLWLSELSDVTILIIKPLVAEGIRLHSAALCRVVRGERNSWKEWGLHIAAPLHLRYVTWSGYPAPGSARSVYFQLGSCAKTWEHSINAGQKIIVCLLCN